MLYNEYTNRANLNVRKSGFNSTKQETENEKAVLTPPNKKRRMKKLGISVNTNSLLYLIKEKNGKFVFI